MVISLAGYCMALAIKAKNTSHNIYIVKQSWNIRNSGNPNKAKIHYLSLNTLKLINNERIMGVPV